MSNDAVSDVLSTYYEGSASDAEDEKVLIRIGPLWIRQICCTHIGVLQSTGGDEPTTPIVTVWDWDGESSEADAVEVTKIALSFWLGTTTLVIPDDSYLNIVNSLYVSTSGFYLTTTAASQLRLTLFYT